MAFLIPLVGE